jgi:hypothetical protein
MLLHISSPVTEIWEVSVGANDRTDRDRLLHRNGDSLHDRCGSYVQASVEVHEVNLRDGSDASVTSN